MIDLLFDYKIGTGGWYWITDFQNIYGHSSEKRGLRSTFLSGEMLQNLPYS